MTTRSAREDEATDFGRSLAVDASASSGYCSKRRQSEILAHAALINFSDTTVM